MKSKVTFAAIALCFALSSQSFGVDLLTRMLGGSGCGCDTSCCATPEPSCGCDGIGMLRGRFFNRGCCDNACDKGCAAKPACDSCGNGCGHNACCRPKLLSFDVKCLSIPVVVPKICLPKIQLPRPCLRSCCDKGCDSGCCAKAEPACGADKCCKPKCCKPKCCKPKCCKPKCCCSLLDRIRARMAAARCCKPACDSSCCDKGCKKKAATCGCEPACGSEYSNGENKKDAPKPEAAKETASTAVPPAPVVDPAAFGGVKAQRISDIN